MSEIIYEVRPTTGRLLIGGQLDHKDNIYLISWFADHDPAKKLFSATDFPRSDQYHRFFLGALQAPFPDFMLDLPKCHATGEVQYDVPIAIIYLLEGNEWWTAIEVGCIHWSELEVGGKCRPWSDEWFRSKLMELSDYKFDNHEQMMSKVQKGLSELRSIVAAARA